MKEANLRDYIQYDPTTQHSWKDKTVKTAKRLVVAWLERTMVWICRAQIIFRAVNGET